jgi:hypothetical protein
VDVWAAAHWHAWSPGFKESLVLAWEQVVALLVEWPQVLVKHCHSEVCA